MYLTGEEEKILKGEEGPGMALAMELLVKIGDVFDAD
ncbi:MAG: aconitase X, partial [TACK group archaeon]|nr:aconitase X [TACK group archaeon]